MFFPWILTQGGSGGYSLPAASIHYGTKMDRAQILKKVYDETTGGIRSVDAGPASGNHGTKMDADQVWKNCYDPDNDALRVVLVAAGADPVYTLGDADWIIKDCYDPDCHALRIIDSVANSACGSLKDSAQIFRFVYLSSSHALHAVTPVVGSGTYGTKRDFDQVVRQALNKTVGKMVIVGD